MMRGNLSTKSLLSSVFGSRRLQGSWWKKRSKKPSQRRNSTECYDDGGCNPLPPSSASSSTSSSSSSSGRSDHSSSSNSSMMLQFLDRLYRTTGPAEDTIITSLSLGWDMLSVPLSPLIWALEQNDTLQRVEISGLFLASVAARSSEDDLQRLLRAIGHLPQLTHLVWDEFEVHPLHWSVLETVLKGPAGAQLETLEFCFVELVVGSTGDEEEEEPWHHGIRRLHNLQTLECWDLRVTNNLTSGRAPASGGGIGRFLQSVLALPWLESLLLVHLCLKDSDLQDSSHMITTIARELTTGSNRHLKQLQILSPERCALEYPACQALQTMLEHNQTLQSLILHDVQINDAGMQALASGLATNTSLQQLQCKGNTAVTVQGVEAMVQVLDSNNTTLTSLLVADDMKHVTTAAMPRHQQQLAMYTHLNQRGWLRQSTLHLDCTPAQVVNVLAEEDDVSCLFHWISQHPTLCCPKRSNDHHHHSNNNNNNNNNNKSVAMTTLGPKTPE